MSGCHQFKILAPVSVVFSGKDELFAKVFAKKVLMVTSQFSEFAKHGGQDASVLNCSNILQWRIRLHCEPGRRDRGGVNKGGGPE